MGYELTLKAELVGVEGTYLEGLEATLEIEGLVEYENEPDSYDFEVQKLLDTEQGIQAKKCIGHDSECDKYCVALRAILRQYPWLSQ